MNYKKNKREIVQTKKKLQEFKTRLKRLKDEGFNPLQNISNEINILEKKLKKSILFYRILNKKNIIIAVFCVLIIYFIGGNIFSSILFPEKDSNDFFYENESIVEFSNLKNNDYVYGEYMITGSANNPYGNISSVYIKIDDNPWLIVNGTENWIYEWNITNVSEGIHKISSRISDGIEYFIGETIKVNVDKSFVMENQKPKVEIIYPYDGVKISDSIEITGVASDQDGNISKVEIQIDNEIWIQVEGTTKWQYFWNTKSVNSGNHTISVRSYDGQEYSLIKSISVYVYFSDDFQDNTLKNWNILKGDWEIEIEGENYFAKSPISGKRRKIIVSKTTIPENVIITAKVKCYSNFESSSNIGVGIYADQEGNCYFINLDGPEDKIHISKMEAGKNINEILDMNDQVLAENNIWYILKIMLDNNNIYAKRWKVENIEPANWQVYYYNATPFGQHILLGAIPEFLINEISFDNISVSFIGLNDSIDYTLYPTDDAEISQYYPDRKNGLLPRLVVSNRYGHPSHPNLWEDDPLIRFDLSSIPATSRISSAILKLFYFEHSFSNPKDREITLYRITGDWDELTINWNTRPDHYPEITSTDLIPSSPGFWMEWDVTEDVRKFIEGTDINYGWKLMDEGPWNKYDMPDILFRSKEFENKSYWPKLEINIVE